MLGQVRIEGAGTMEAAVVMIDHFFERRETPVMHIGRCHRYVAQRGSLELSAIRFQTGDLHPSEVARKFLQPIVHELVIAEEVPAVTMKTVRSAQAARGIG